MTAEEIWKDLFHDPVRCGDLVIVTAYYHLDTGTVEPL
jgi:hypothetical protein